MTERVQPPPRVVLDDATNSIVAMRDAADVPVTFAMSAMPAPLQAVVSGAGNQAFNRNPIRSLGTAGDSYMAGVSGGGMFPMVQDAVSARSATNYAVGGKSITQMISEQFPLLLAGGHDAIILLMSGNGTTSPYTEAELTTMATEMRRAIDQCIAVNIYPIVCLHPPVNSGRTAGDTSRARSILGQLADAYGVPFFDTSVPLASVDTGLGAAGDYVSDLVHLNASGAGKVTERLRAMFNARRSDNPFLATCRVDATPSPTKRHANAISNGLFMAAGGAFSTTGWGGTNCTLAAGTNSAEVLGNVCKVTKTATGSMNFAAGGLTYANCGVTTGKIYVGLRMRSIASAPSNHNISVRPAVTGMTAMTPRVCEGVLPNDGRWRTFERIYSFPPEWGSAGSNEVYFQCYVDPTTVGDTTGDIIEIGQVTIRELRLA